MTTISSQDRHDPVRFAQEVCDEICERMGNGESLTQICKDGHMPAKGTVTKWAKGHETFGKQYARAREALLLFYADQIIDIADDSSDDYVERQRSDGASQKVIDQENIARARLRVDARKWLLSKLMPKVYGDKLALGGDADAPPIQLQRIERVIVRPRDEADAGSG